MYKICFTGHRPNKLKGGYADCAKYLYPGLYEYLESVSDEVELAISGMALGVDQIAAQVCLDLDIPVLAAIPCQNMEQKWPETSQVKFRDLCDAITEANGQIVYVSNHEYDLTCMQKRNEYMVDNSDKVIAIWNGDTYKSGTYNCIKYAKQQHKEIINLWDAIYKENN